MDSANQKTARSDGGSGAPRSWCHRPMRLVVLGFGVGVGWGRRIRRPPRLSSRCVEEFVCFVAVTEDISGIIVEELVARYKEEVEDHITPSYGNA